MNQHVWYEDIVSNINPKITIPYIFNKDLAQNNITGVAHKIQYGPVMFEVLLGNPIYMTDNTQNGTIIVYPIYELKPQQNGENRKIGIYEIVQEDLPKVYANVTHNEPNVEMLGRPYFYNFVLHENRLPGNRINPVLRDNQLKYGRGFDWNAKNKIKIGNYDIKNIINDEQRLNRKQELERELEREKQLALELELELEREKELERQKASLEAREKKRQDLIDGLKLKQLDKLDTQRSNRRAKTARKTDKSENIFGDVVDAFNNNFVLNRTRKNKQVYVYDESHNWLQKYMKNINYDIVDNDDVTLFGAVSKLVDESAQDIREKVSNFVDIDDFMKQREMYDKLKTAIVKQHENKKPDKKALQKLNDSIRDYEYLENINTFDSFKLALKSIKGNMHLLTVIERMYENKYKIIVLKNNQQTSKQRESKFEKIVICNNNTLDPQTKTIKKHMQYGILSFDKGNYNSVKYDKKSLLRYSDVPNSIQKRLIDNCINV